MDNGMIIMVQVMHCIYLTEKRKINILFIQFYPHLSRARVGEY